MAIRNTHVVDERAEKAVVTAYQDLSKRESTFPGSEFKRHHFKHVLARSELNSFLTEKVQQ